MATIKNFERKGGFKLDGFKELVIDGRIRQEQYALKSDVLVAHTDLTQNADIIGNAEILLSCAGYDKVVFSMDIVKVVPISSLSNYALSAILQSPRFKQHCLGYVNGTTVLHLSKRALPEYNIGLPSDLSELKPFDEIVTSLYQRIETIIEENRRLEALRDTLIPKILSGVLDVSSIDL